MPWDASQPPCTLPTHTVFHDVATTAPNGSAVNPYGAYALVAASTGNGGAVHARTVAGDTSSYVARSLNGSWGGAAVSIRINRSAMYPTLYAEFPGIAGAPVRTLIFFFNLYYD